MSQFTGSSTVDLFLNPTGPLGLPSVSFPAVPLPFLFSQFYYRSDPLQELDEIRVGTLPMDVAATCSTPVPADFDQDCLVDQDDLAIFKACWTGPNAPYDPNHLPVGCALAPDAQGHIAADLDHDGDVDQDDFGIFQRCFSGSILPADPNCAR